MSDDIGSIAAAAILAVILICLFYRYRRHRTERLTRELLTGYFQSNLPVDQLGRRTREVASRRFIGGGEFYALAISAFQTATDAEFRQRGRSVEVEKKLLQMLAALKAEFGLTDRYRIEGWRAGRD